MSSEALNKALKCVKPAPQFQKVQGNYAPRYYSYFKAFTGYNFQ
jgi:hypothetical protein